MGARVANCIRAGDGLGQGGVGVQNLHGRFHGHPAAAVPTHSPHALPAERQVPNPLRSLARRPVHVMS